MPSSRASEEQHQAEQRPPERDLEAELAQMEDRYKRALADLDNYRKRSARELDRLVQEKRDALIRDWLDVVDGVERALRMHPDGGVHEGLRAVFDHMESVLARQGVARVGEVGERFDPHRHEAVEVREAGEVPDRTVVEVLRSGFAVGDRVVRPAQVVVSRVPQPQPEA